MGVGEPYSGDTERANRLFAARRAAGFKSARQAAQKCGWSEATYRAHETATRHLKDGTARQYAKAFGVAAAWLLKGEGTGPKVDTARDEKFAVRKYHSLKDARENPLAAAGKRLRLSRRLAGFRSVTAAAKKFGFGRTTLNAHEQGQNNLSDEAVRAYGAAFGVRSDWLARGTLPSGYPPEIEKYIDSLMDLHNAPESEARDHLPAFVAPSVRPAALKKISKLRAKPTRSPNPGSVDVVPEISLDHLYEAAVRETGFASAKPTHQWTFPRNYLSETLGCKPEAAIIVAALHDFLHIRRFDRLIVDSTPAAPIWGETYLLLGKRTRELSLFERSKENSQNPVTDPDSFLIGRLCGLIGSFTQQTR
jgi:hypothetical protein